MAFGTKYLFQFSIALLRLIQSDLLRLDFTGMYEYLNGFRDDGVTLPDVELIIRESYKVHISQDQLDQLQQEYNKQESEKNTKPRQLTLRSSVMEAKIERTEIIMMKQENPENQVVQQIEEQSVANVNADNMMIVEDLQNGEEAKDDQQQMIMNTEKFSKDIEIQSIRDSMSNTSMFKHNIINYEVQQFNQQQNRIQSARYVNHTKQKLEIAKSEKSFQNQAFSINRNQMIFGLVHNNEESFQKKSINDNQTTSKQNFSHDSHRPQNNLNFHQDVQHLVDQSFEVVEIEELDQMQADNMVLNRDNKGSQTIPKIDTQALFKGLERSDSIRKMNTEQTNNLQAEIVQLQKNNLVFD